MAVPDKVTKKISLDLSDVPRSRRTKVKQDISEFVEGEILRSVSQGRSPVKGRGFFKKLSNDYADKEKGGDKNPNLELEGDMLDALESRNVKDGIEVGIFRRSQVPKADGHNNFSGLSRLPERRFIPKEDEEFKRNINSGIKRIIDQNKQAKINKPKADNIITAQNFATNFVSQITIDDLFDDEL